MLQFEMLKSRLNSVKRYQTELDVLDIFLLLTTAKINPNWQEYEKKLAIRQCKDWQFDTKNSNDVDVYLDLVDYMLIYVNQSPFIQKIDVQYHWYEQWMMFYITNKKLTPTEIISLIKQLNKRPVSKSQKQLYEFLVNENPCFETKINLANFILKNNDYNQAITKYEILMCEYQLNEEAYRQILYGLVNALLKRNKQYSLTISDAEYALNILLKISESTLWNNDFEKFLKQAQKHVLPDVFHHNSESPLNILNVIGRKTNLFGKQIGKSLGGKEAELPYSQTIITSVPEILIGEKIESYLDKNTRLNHSLFKLLKASKADYGSAIVTSGISLGMLWTYSQIDSQVLNAITFSSQNNPTDFSDLQDIANNISHSEGALNRLTGYVAEQQVAINLIRSGHTVETANTSTQRGWDLLVDGSQVQVKCTLDSNYVLNHFKENPNIPVIVNRELANEIGNHPLVQVDDQLSYYNIQEITSKSIESMNNFDSIYDLIPIPVLSIVFATFKHSKLLKFSEPNIKQFAFNTGIEVGTKTVGMVSGKVIGATIGSVAGPIGTIVGASTFAYIGGVASNTATDLMLRKEACHCRDIVVSKLIDFAVWLKKCVLLPRLQQMEALFETFKHKVVKTLNSQDGFSDQPIYSQLIAIQFEQLERVRFITNWLDSQLKKGEFYQAQAGWVALRESSKFFHPDMKVKIMEVNESLDKYQQSLAI